MNFYEFILAMIRGMSAPTQTGQTGLNRAQNAASLTLTGKVLAPTAPIAPIAPTTPIAPIAATTSPTPIFGPPVVVNGKQAALALRGQVWDPEESPLPPRIQAVLRELREACGSVVTLAARGCAEGYQHAIDAVLKAWALQGVFSAGGFVSEDRVRLLIIWDDQGQKWHQNLEVKINEAKIN